MGPTLVAYLRGAGVGAVGIVEATTATAAVGMARAPWLAAAVAVGRGATAAATGSGPGLDPPAGGEKSGALKA